MIESLFAGLLTGCIYALLALAYSIIFTTTRVVNFALGELIMVAAGFDAHYLDRMGRTNLTEKAFGCLTHMLVGLRAEIDYPPLLFALEGGYHLEALALSVKEVLKALTSDDRDERCITARTKLAEDLVREARKVHAQYGVWADTI